MTKYLPVIFLLITVLACNRNKKKEVHYFYDTENVLKKAEGSSMIHYVTRIPVYTSWGDSITFEISSKGYFLLHFMEHDNDTYLKDTSFSKPASFLNSIDYFDSEWLKKEENLNEFWDYSMYEYGGREDTLEIFIIHPILGTDSIKLERVHRWYKPNREG
ncbi:MAG: hypothetical protein GQ552_03410 [Flavobacteriaceae bacterium]|nr:hypothetical protein [Flavobacteriaceae bacterium]